MNTEINSNQRKFSISRLNYARRLIAVILTALLCFSLFMSELTRYWQTHKLVFIGVFTPIYFLLIVFSLLIAVKALISVREIIVNSQGIEINALFWQQKLAWHDIQSFGSPANLKYAWLKTKSNFYLLAKSEIENYEEFELYIRQYLDIQS